MKKFGLLSFISLVIICQNTYSQTIVSAEGLKEDFSILKKALFTLHPGLNKYNDSITVAGYFDDFEKQLYRDINISQAYLMFSEFIAKIKCGHTYPNYWNQLDIIKNEVFNQPNRLPFTFRLIEGKMLVDKDLSGSGILKRGTEIIKINSVSANDIINTLKKYVRGDGENTGQRLKEIELSGLGEHEAFDILFPLLFPSDDGTYMIEFWEHPKNLTVTVNAITRAERLIELNKLYDSQPESYDSLWSFKILSRKTAYIKLGTFVIWKMKLDWESFIEDAFDQMKDKNILNVIIDIRGNGGGADEVYMKLAEYMINSPVNINIGHSYYKYEKVPEDINQYLNTWDDSFRDRTGDVIKLKNGFYSNPESDTIMHIEPGPNAYKGNYFLLIDAANASATFFLAKYSTDNSLATLVGEETGGNKRGTNGGQMFFLNLPNSKIEIDIPLIGNYPLIPQPDEGIKPDVLVEQTKQDFINDYDAVLNKTLELIEKQ